MVGIVLPQALGGEPLVHMKSELADNLTRVHLPVPA